MDFYKKQKTITPTKMRTHALAVQNLCFSERSGQLKSSAIKQTEIDSLTVPLSNYKIKDSSIWPMKKLKDICKTSSGGTPSRNKKEYYMNGTIPWIKSGEINQGIIYSSEEKITNFGLKNSSAKMFPKNTVLIAMYGATTGKVGLLKIEATTNQAICGILKGEKVLPKFLYMYLQTQTDYMIQLSSGGAQKNISQEIIKNLKIPVPPLEEQKKIAGVLSCIQKAIETQDRLIKATQELQKSTMKYLFTYGIEGTVHHSHKSGNPPLTPKKSFLSKGKLFSRALPFPRRQKSTLHSRHHVTSLDSHLHGNNGFDMGICTSSSKQSDQSKSPVTKQTEIGPLPHRWDIEQLGAERITKIIMGQSPLSEFYNYNKLGLPFYQGKVDFGHYTPFIRQWCSNPLKIAVSNDILISVRAPVGDVNVCTVKSCIGRGLASIRAKEEKLSFLFLFYHLIYRKKDIQRHGVGTTFKSINKSHLHNFKIPVPPLEEQKKIASILRKIDQKITNHRKKKSTLEELFKTTLNRLMTGQIHTHNLKLSTNKIMEQ